MTQRQTTPKNIGASAYKNSQQNYPFSDHSSNFRTLQDVMIV
jgi:hypothetical protein